MVVLCPFGQGQQDCEVGEESHASMGTGVVAVGSVVEQVMSILVAALERSLRWLGNLSATFDAVSLIVVSVFEK